MGRGFIRSHEVLEKLVLGRVHLGLSRGENQVARVRQSQRNRASD